MATGSILRIIILGDGLHIIAMQMKDNVVTTHDGKERGREKWQ